jgi:hypothetical protein
MTFTRRPPWADTPEPVREDVARALGARIADHADLHGGMSPGPAAGLRLADGRLVFVKAVSAEVRAHNHRMIRQEAGILDVLPESVPAPRRLATVERGPWIALVTTWAGSVLAWADRAPAAAPSAAAHRSSAGAVGPSAGGPVSSVRAPGSLADVPGSLAEAPGCSARARGSLTGAPASSAGGSALWTDASIAAVAEACRSTSGHSAPGALPPVAERIFDFDGWRRVLERGGGDGWDAAHAGSAAELVAGWPRWTAGASLVHRDVRLDNTAVDAKAGSAVLLDWGYAAAGAPWIDLAQLAADVVATGHVLGPQAATDRAYRLLAELPSEASRFVVGLAGMWCIRAATITDTVMPGIAAWRRARSAALRPLVSRLISGLGGSVPADPGPEPIADPADR